MLLLLPLIFHTIGALNWEPDLRIVGGYPVPIIERPFHVVLYRIIQREAIPDCGGSIIGDRFVVTAAHCVYGVADDLIFVRAGIDDLDDDRSMFWHAVERVIPHEEYIPTSDRVQYDIALLITKVPFEYSRKIQPIDLPEKPPRPDSEVVVSGFGVTKEGNQVMSRILMAVSVTVLDRRNCKDLLSQVAENLRFSSTHFCAAYLEGGRDACQGDSGGPVTMGNTLMGIVSWGIGCAEEMVPAFYTDVSQFRGWLTGQMRKYSGRFQKFLIPN